MITKYDKYKYYNKHRFSVDLEKLLPENNNIKFSSGARLIEIFCYDKINSYSYLLYSIEITDYYIKLYKYYGNNSRKQETFQSLEQLIKWLKDFFKEYYRYEVLDNTNIFINHKVDILRLPVLNKDLYSEYIYKLILSDESHYSKYLKYIEQYLNDKIKDKLKHLIDASNFDLL